MLGTAEASLDTAAAEMTQCFEHTVAAVCTDLRAAKMDALLKFFSCPSRQRTIALESTGIQPGMATGLMPRVTFTATVPGLATYGLNWK